MINAPTIQLDTCFKTEEPAPLKPKWVPPDYTDLFTIVDLNVHKVKAIKCIQACTKAGLLQAKLIVEHYMTRTAKYQLDEWTKEITIYPSAVSIQTIIKEFDRYLGQFDDIRPTVAEACEASKEILAAKQLYELVEERLKALDIQWDMRRALNEMFYVHNAHYEPAEFDDDIPF